MSGIGTEVVAAVEGLTVRYGRLTAVSDLSFAVERGSVYALLGRNGSGKSSTVTCLLGHRRPASGRALLFGRDAWACRRRAMLRLGFVPETPDLPPDSTAEHIARFASRLYPRWDDADFAGRLERFRVPQRVPVARLSKGQRRLVALALALAPAPELLVLDDPTLGLDAVARRTLLEEIVGELADRGTTVIVTTHDLAGIEAIADHVGILREGRLLVDEPLESLKMRFRRLRWSTPPGADAEAVDAALALADPVVTRKAAGLFEVVAADWNDEALARLTGELGAGLRVEPMSLEEIFVALCGDDAGGGS